MYVSEIVGLCNTMTCTWQVVVLDFPPRLCVEEAEQELLRMVYHSVCVDQGMFKSKLTRFAIDVFTAMLVNNQ